MLVQVGCVDGEYDYSGLYPGSKVLLNYSPLDLLPPSSFPNTYLTSILDFLKLRTRESAEVCI